MQAAAALTVLFILDRLAALQAGPGQAEPGQAELGRAEPGRAEPGRAELGWAEPSRTEPGQAEPGQAELGWAELSRTEPGQAEPGQAELGWAELSRTEPGQAEPGQAELGWAEPSRTEPGQAEPGQAEPGQAELGWAELSRTEPGQARPSQAESGQSKPSRAQLGQAEPGRNEPGRTEPGQAEPGQAEPGRTSGLKERKKNQPHIVFILTDDQGFNDVGYHNPSIRTPTLDKMAAEGVKLENYYVQPICTPSRSQLITGRYQIHTGLQHSIIRPRQPSCLPSHLDTLPERLRDAGYATHLVGKWHLGFYRKACLPTRKGFDTFFGSLTGSVDYYSYESCDAPGLCGYDLHDGEEVAWGQEGKYSTALFTQKARKILENHDPAGKPLFLLLSLQAVHTPLQSPKSYIYPYRDMANVARRKFAAMVSTVDEAVRNVTYALRKYGFYRNSVIIFSTDNGAQPFTGGSNWPLRGRKGTYWEGGIRGVAFVHSPLLRRRRRVSKALLHITDWFPTLVGLAGGNLSQSRGLDGFDVWPTISEGKDSPRQEILHNIDPLNKPLVRPVTWKDPAHGASGSKSKGPALKKKKEVLRQKPPLKIKTTRKSKPRPKCKLPPKLRCKPVQKPKPPQRPSHHKPHLESRAGGTPPQGHQRLKSKPRWTTSPNQNRSQLRPPQPKAKTPLIVRLKSRRSFSQHQNRSSPAPQAVWDTSVQAAIRVGDWKLLTGYPGHGDWVPPQVLPTLPGRWWNLERDVWMFHKQKNVWLFNIADDPFERRDLADQRPDLVHRLLERLAFYNQTAVPVYFPPDDPRADPSRHANAWTPWVGEEEEEGKYHGVYKKGRSSKKKKKKKKKCRMCKLQSFFLKLNTRMMSNRI